VKPVNAMGTSKAMMEKLVCSQNPFGGATTFCCVRYGNVMGSRGSVIPLFLRQIREDAPMTLTVPHMTRFLMTLDQSVDLVFHAVVGLRPGEKIHEEMITRSDSPNTLDLGRYFAILPAAGEYSVDVYAARTGARRVPEGFCYESGTNPDFLTVDALRRLIHPVSATDSSAADGRVPVAALA